MGVVKFTRRRSLEILSLFLAGSLTYSMTFPALLGATDYVKELSTKMSRLPHGAYTDNPHEAFLGDHPGRAPQTRGGLWKADAVGAHALDGMLASTAGGNYYQTPSGEPVAIASGSPLPWEGSAGSESGVINTGNGNKLTSVDLFSWKQRGGLPVAFALHHNSEGGTAGEVGYGWSTSYDIYINTSSGSPVVHWGNGLSIPYTSSGGSGGTTTGGTSAGSTTGFGGFTTGNPMATGPVASASAEGSALDTSYTPPAGIYDSLTQLTAGTWVLTKKDGTVYNFNSSGYCTSIVDRNGNTLTINWNGSHLITSIVDATGRTITLGITSGKLTSVTDPLSHVWSLTQNPSGDLTSISWPVLSSSTYTDQFSYNSVHDITTHTDRNGKNWTFGYNSDGSIASETDPLGHSTSISYTTSAATITDPLGHSAVDNYSSGVEASHVDESSYSTSYTARDANYNPTSITDARGNIWAYTYDSLGNALTIHDPLSHVKTYTYNGFAEVLTFTDALSHVTTNTYDTHGNLLTVTDPLSHVTTNAYDLYGEIVSSQDPLSHTTTFGYSSGTLSYIHTPLGNATTFGYDGLGRVTSVTDPLSHVESTTYDVWGRKSVVTHADSSTKSYSYLPTGEVSSETDENGHATAYGHDNAGRLTSVTNPRGDVESYGYDNANHKTSVTNGRGYTRTYLVSNRGETTKQTLPDGMVEQWAYDGNGNTTAYVDGIGNTIGYVFDAANRQTGITYPSGTNTGFSYDNADRKTGMSDSTGSTSWTYDNASRVTALSTPQGSTSYVYDSANRKTSMTENGTLVTSYVYDNDSRQTSLTNSDSETTSWTFDNAARAMTQTVASGEVSTFGYDSRNRETSVSHATSGSTVLESESYVYDYVGNLSSKTVGSTTTSYTYDAADQLLTESNGGSYSASYTYDANGNRTSKTVGGVTDTYTVDNGDKLTSTSTKSYTYDADGRTKTVVSSAGTTTLAYDYEGRLTSIANPGGLTYAYSYNGLDTRVGKNDGTSQSYRRDGVDVTAPVLSDGVSRFTPRVSQHLTATTFNHADRLGSYVAQTNPSQVLTAAQTFDAFGIQLASTGSPAGPFGFVGSQGYQSDASSLRLLGHRYYDASTGRFLTRDSARDGRNWYGYCGANPLKAIDPSGLWSLYRWFYTGDGNASDEEYESGLNQAMQTLKVWSIHFAIDNGIAFAPTDLTLGPFPKKWVPKFIARTPMMEGSSIFTSGTRAFSQKIFPRLEPSADFVKENQLELWIIVEAGIAWTATYQTLNDPNSILPDGGD